MRAKDAPELTMAQSANRFGPPHASGKAERGAASAAHAWLPSSNHEPARSLPLRLGADSVDEVCELVRRARAERLTVRMLGTHDTTWRRARAEDMLIDTTSFAKIHEITSNTVTVDAGARWLDIVMRSLFKQRVPRLLPDCLDETVGSVLAAGGVTPAAHRIGLAADNVCDLEVITDSGELVRCSQRRRADLFHAALYGLAGQPLIARATLRLVRHRSEVRSFMWCYERLVDLLDAQRAVTVEGVFDRVTGEIVTAPGGNWLFMLRGVVFFDRGTPPSNEVFEGNKKPIDRVIQNKEYTAWLFRWAGRRQFLASAGLQEVPEARVDWLLPEDRAEAMLEALLARLDPRELVSLPATLIALPRHRARGFVQSAETLCFALTLQRFSTCKGDVQSTSAKIDEARTRANSSHGTACRPDESTMEPAPASATIATPLGDPAGGLRQPQGAAHESFLL